ncbi:MAG: glycosyltransferase family 9 protein [Candidatus Goldbacteria bacterium]|nr:glycosyltransferase family 9 protein [Candidatus Goldiibacteriota bacterium]
MFKKKILHAKQLNLKEITSLLVIAPDNFEDFILATPAISALKEALPPDGKLTVMIPSKLRKIASRASGIDKILCFNFINCLPSFFNLMFGGYEVLVNFASDSFNSILASAICPARAKVAYALKKETKIYNFFHNLKLQTIDSPQHRIVKYLNLVRFIGANTYDFTPKINITEEDKKYAADFIKRNEITNKDIIIGIHATSLNESKRWSINKFSQLVRNVVEKFNARVIVYYHENEKKRLEEFMHVIRNKALIPDTTDYMKLAALSTYFTCFICNETDFMHLLSPFTNLIVIWSDTDPDTNKPAGNNHEILQASDGSPDSVPVSKVTDAIKKYINIPS